MDKKLEDLKVLIDSNTIQKRIEEVADSINSNYNKYEILNVICILKGAVMFYTELAKHLKMPVKMEFISLSSYGNSTHSSGKVKSLNLSLPTYENENILIVEDIIDTGLTLDFLIRFIKQNCRAKNVELAVLFDKKCARKYNIKPDYAAFDIDDKFIVGFGLDYQEYYRNLDFVGYFE